MEETTENKYKTALEAILKELPLSPSVPIIIRIKDIVEGALEIKEAAETIK